MSNLGSYVRQQRECSRMHKNRLAELCGWRNLNKGRRVIESLEEYGTAHPDHLRRIVAALDLDRAVVAEKIAKDRQEREQEFEKWASEPTEPVLLLKGGGLFCIRRPIPPELHDDEAGMIALAERYAREWRVMSCIILSRRACVYFHAGGEQSYRVEASVEHPQIGPGIRVGRQTVQSLFTMSA
ncbi:MAG: hypothetical protein HUU31_24190 [Anaerolineae bacterium]|nr:hypothetical protein [Anaerolineae bacterium]